MELIDYLNNTKNSLPLLYPELGMVLGIVLLLLLDLFIKEERRGIFKYFTLAILVATYAYSVDQYCPLMFGRTLFQEKLLLSKISVVSKILFQLTGIGVVFFSIFDDKKTKNQERTVAYYVLLLGVVLGAHLMVMSRNLLVTFMAVELVSLSSYLLTAIDKNKTKGFEGGIKYLIFGAVASAFMLYGMSWLYGLSGSLAYEEVFSRLFTTPSWFTSLMLFFVFIGFLFKIAAFPMHSWVPDVYQSAPNAIVAFFAVVPKIAGIIVMYFITIDLPSEVYLKLMFILSLSSMLVGNLAALRQKDIKRMLGYSSIAHAGFLLIGIVVPTSYGIKAVLFYGFMLLAANMGAFFLIRKLCQTTKSTLLASYSGMARKAPLIGIVAIIIMTALTGLPPTMGFSAKLFLFTSLWEAYQSATDPMLLLLFIVGLFNTVLGLFYYIKLPYYLFFKESNNINDISLTIGNKFFILLCIVPLIILFVKADWLFNIL